MGCFTAVSAIPRSSSSDARRSMVLALRPKRSNFQMATSSKGRFRLRASRISRLSSGRSSLLPLMPSST